MKFYEPIVVLIKILIFFVIKLVGQSKNYKLAEYKIKIISTSIYLGKRRYSSRNYFLYV